MLGVGTLGCADLAVDVRMGIGGRWPGGAAVGVEAGVVCVDKYSGWRDPTRRIRSG